MRRKCILIWLIRCFLSLSCIALLLLWKVVCFDLFPFATQSKHFHYLHIFANGTPDQIDGINQQLSHGLNNDWKLFIVGSILATVFAFILVTTIGFYRRVNVNGLIVFASAFSFTVVVLLKFVLQQVMTFDSGLFINDAIITFAVVLIGSHLSLWLKKELLDAPPAQQVNHEVVE